MNMDGALRKTQKNMMSNRAVVIPPFKEAPITVQGSVSGRPDDAIISL